MRWLSRAICTSGEPVSLSCRRYWPMTFTFAALSSDIFFRSFWGRAEIEVGCRSGEPVHADGRGRLFQHATAQRAIFFWAEYTERPYRVNGTRFDASGSQSKRRVLCGIVLVDDGRRGEIRAARPEHVRRNEALQLQRRRGKVVVQEHGLLVPFQPNFEEPLRAARVVRAFV